MEIIYHTGILIRHCDKEEFTSRSRPEPHEAFECMLRARVGRYHKITFYAQVGDKTVGLEYDSLKHLNSGEPDFSEKVRKIVLEKIVL